MVPFILNFKKGKPHRKLFTSYGIDTSDTPPNSKSASAFSNSAQNIDSPTKGHRRTKSVGTIGRNNPLKKSVRSSHSSKGPRRNRAKIAQDDNFKRGLVTHLSIW